MTSSGIEPGECCGEPGSDLTARRSLFRSHVAEATAAAQYPSISRHRPNLIAMIRLFQVDTDELIEQGEELVGELGDKVDEVSETVRSNPELAAILLVIGVLTAVIFFWGVFKQAIKAAVIGGLLSAGAWYWYFNVK